MKMQPRFLNPISYEKPAANVACAAVSSNELLAKGCFGLMNGVNRFMNCGAGSGVRRVVGVASCKSRGFGSKGSKAGKASLITDTVPRSRIHPASCTIRHLYFDRVASEKYPAPSTKYPAPSTQ